MGNRSPEVVRKTMQAIRSKNTRIEIVIGKALWSKGYRYRKNDKSVMGSPDFTFKKLKIAVFCDSEFWHGKDWESLQARLQTNREFWVNKIKKNIERDAFVNKELTNGGWQVLRFWEKDILKHLDSCIQQIVVAIENKRQNSLRI